MNLISIFPQNFSKFEEKVEEFAWRGWSPPCLCLFKWISPFLRRIPFPSPTMWPRPIDKLIIDYSLSNRIESFTYCHCNLFLSLSVCHSHILILFRLDIDRLRPSASLHPLLWPVADLSLSSLSLLLHATCVFTIPSVHSLHCLIYPYLI